MLKRTAQVTPYYPSKVVFFILEGISHLDNHALIKSFHSLYGYLIP